MSSRKVKIRRNQEKIDKNNKPSNQFFDKSSKVGKSLISGIKGDKEEKTPITKIGIKRGGYSLITLFRYTNLKTQQKSIRYCIIGLILVKMVSFFKYFHSFNTVPVKI